MAGIHRDQELIEKRKQVQKEIVRLEPQIRRRLQGKFAALTRGWYHIDAVLDSARRRIDRAIACGALCAVNVQSICALAMKIAENVALDELRRRRRERQLQDALSTTRGQDFGIEDKTTILVDSIVDQLSPDDRDLLCRWMRGLTEQQIASSLGIGLETYRTRRRRLWNRIRVLGGRSG